MPVSPESPTLWIVTGVPGAGRSTTARALAAGAPCGVHIEGDVLQRLIVSGGVPPQPQASVESERQIALDVHHQCLLAWSFLAEGFTVAVDYVVATRARLRTYLDLLSPHPVRFVVLAPDLVVTEARDRGRGRGRPPSPPGTPRRTGRRTAIGSAVWDDRSSRRWRTPSAPSANPTSTCCCSATTSTSGDLRCVGRPSGSGWPRHADHLDPKPTPSDSLYKPILIRCHHPPVQVGRNGVVVDIVDEINAIHRVVGRADTPNGEARTVLLRRTYETTVEDVWDAVTNPERLPRWFLPVSGDLRLGGRYQIEGNAGGEIIRCEPPRLLRLTWIFGEPVEGGFSEVEVRLSPGTDPDDATHTVLELEHIAVIDSERWTEYGPGAAGVGWDLSLLGLGLHLGGESIDDPGAWEQSREGREFATLSSNSWGAAAIADGEAPDAVATMVANTTAFYAPDDPAPEPSAG